MMCSNSYLNHYIKVGQHPKCVVSSIERAGQPLVKQVVSSAEICRGVHYYEDINVSDILLNEVTGEFTVHFDRVLKTVTEDEYGVDLGAWNDGITKTPMVAKLDKNLNILSTN